MTCIPLNRENILQGRHTEITYYEPKFSLTVLLTSGTSTWRLWVEPMPSFSSTAVSIAAVLPKKLDLKMIQVDEKSQYRQNMYKNIEICQLRDLWFSFGTAQYNIFYNMSNYPCILIGCHMYLWSTGGQMHTWCH